MLIDEPKAILANDIMQFVGALNRDTRTSILRKGVYEIAHFGSSCFLRDYDEYFSILDKDNEPLASYGVVDYPEQLFEKAPMLETSDRKFVTCFTRITKDAQPKEGGWRWKKWGMYIGDKEPSCEYIADDPNISEVFCYHIYEKKGGEK